MGRGNFEKEEEKTKEEVWSIPLVIGSEGISDEGKGENGLRNPKVSYLEDETLPVTQIH